MKRIIPVVIVCLFALSAFAQRGPGPGGPPPPPRLDSYLSLTDSQKAAAEAIEAELRTSTEPLHAQLRALHEQLEQARDAANAKFLALLTAEQRAKFEAFQAAARLLRRGGPGGGAHP